VGFGIRAARTTMCAPRPATEVIREGQQHARTAMSTVSPPLDSGAAAPVREARAEYAARRPRRGGLPAGGADSRLAQLARLLGCFLSPWRWSLLLRRLRLVAGARLFPVRRRLLLRGERVLLNGKRRFLFGRRRMLLLRDRLFAQFHQLVQRHL
jgi:hypothetical protein